ncbi:MAG: cyclic-di-AMP receptor [Anaerolineae bacterium]|nr:cyclic-di-AMP receptor [Anaerolineae bacterium]
MKMVMAVMPRGEAERVLQALVAADHTATYAETRGGVLRQAQMMLFIAVESEDLEHVLGIVEKSCRSEPRVEKVEGEEAANAPMPARPRLGGAVVFIWDIERSETY